MQRKTFSIRRMTIWACKMQYFNKIVCIFILCLFFASNSSANDAFEGRFLKPLNWRLQREINVPSDKLPAFSAKLGGQIKDLTNRFYNAAGIQLQINVLEAPTEKAAVRLYRSLLNIRQNELFVSRSGTTVYEFICSNLSVIQKAQAALGLRNQETINWHVSMALAPITKADYQQWNILYNDLMNYRSDPTPSAERQLAKTANYFTFSDRVTLIDPAYFSEQDTFVFKPAPTARQKSGDNLQYSFENLPLICQIPLLQVQARVSLKPFQANTQHADIDQLRLTRSTDFWPVGDKQIRSLKDALIAPDMDVSEKAQRLLGWINENIAYGGNIIGSRYGVKKVLEQRYGHCWDKSDVFITLCRAAGIPARQVNGWLHGTGGHVWAEIYLPDQGWMPVDATTSWLGVSLDYIPFSISEEGHITFVYWDKPQISRDQ